MTESTTDASDACDDNASVASGTTLLVAKAMRERLQDADGARFRCGQCVAPALDALVTSVLAKAVERAKSNGRKTVRGCDI